MSRSTISQLPADAIPCDGPLMFSSERFISPNGALYKVHPSTHRIQVLKPCGSRKQYYSWDNAKKIVDGQIVAMDPIEGFYVLNRGGGQVLIRALVAYYFVQKLENPQGMRAQLINNELPISSANVHWITASEQTTERMNNIREIPNPTPTYIESTDINFDDYSEYHGYMVNNNGTQVLKRQSNGKFKEMSIRTSSDGYKNVSLHINGITKNYRMNRLMATIRYGELSNDQVIDHVDGNILNNAISNLAIVDTTENIRRGRLATKFVKVNPVSMEIVERIRCIREYCDEHEDLDHRELSMRLSTAEIYKNYIWLREEDKNDLYQIINDKIHIITFDYRMRSIREQIQNLLERGSITEDMIPLTNDIPQLTDAMSDIIYNLDPRRGGRDDMRVDTDSMINANIPCCRVLSYFGGTDAKQIFICLKTLLIFARSRDNILIVDRQKCPLCVFDRVNSSRNKFSQYDPESSIPIYTYTHARQTAINPESLKFIGKHLTTADAIKDEHGNDPANPIGVMLPLRKSLFNHSSGYFAKTNIPKRAKCREMYVSFYPPTNGFMDETNPDWILRRRLDCPIIQAMRTKFGNSE